MEQKAKGKAAKTKDDKNDKNVKMSAVKELLDKGKKNGSLTYKEIMEAMDHIDL
ncbi:MAG: RNA polymerase sigma factor region1.1 domain-containing protein, partial [Clostridium butyricum]